MTHFLLPSTPPGFYPCPPLSSASPSSLSSLLSLSYNVTTKESISKWHFFSPKDGDIAICKHELSYKTSTSNLKRHMENKHPTVKIEGISAKTFITGHDTVTDDEDELEHHPPKKTPTTSKEHSMSAEKSRSKLQVFRFGSSDQATPPEQSMSTSTATTSTAPGEPIIIPSVPHISSTKSTSTQQTLAAFLPKKVSLRQKDKIDQAFTMLFTKDFQPFSIVEDEGFTEFCKAMNPSYILPSRKTITKTIIPAKFEECLENTKSMVKEAVSVCLTTDCWTSMNCDSFMAITAHFISKEFKLISVVLQCEQFSGRHTAQNLANALKDLANVWGIAGKIALVVSDNASNITKAVRDLGWKHIGCFAHSINLVVRSALEANAIIVELIEKIRKIVSHFKRSCVSTEKLLLYQKNANEPNNVPKKLVQDVVTRWNSTYLMLRRFILLHEPLKATIALLDKNDIPILTQDEWKMACELMLCLKPFFTVTESISGEKYSTVSLMIPLSNSLSSICDLLIKREFKPDVNDVAKALSENVKDRFGNLENSQTLSLITFLDPRFKHLCFSRPEVPERVKERVISMVTSQITIANKNKNTNEEKQPEEKEDDVDELSVFSNLDTILSKKKKKGTNTSRAIVEVDRYLEDENLDRQNDPLIWWKTEGLQYPHMRKIVEEKFCCLATSVPCERIFSKAGNLISERRNRLSGNTAKMLIFLNQNLPIITTPQNKDLEMKKKSTVTCDYDEEKLLNKIINKITKDQ